MQIVIEIEEEVYKECVPYKDTPIISNLANHNPEITHAIANGTPLPKGHGDLKDVSKIHLDKFVNCKNYSLHPLHSEDFKRGYNSAIDDVWNVFREAQTIIEADKAESEDKK